MKSQGGEESISNMMMNSMKMDGRYDQDNELILGSVDEATGIQRIWDDISGQELNSRNTTYTRRFPLRNASKKQATSPLGKDGWRSTKETGIMPTTDPGR